MHGMIKTPKNTPVLFALIFLCLNFVSSAQATVTISNMYEALVPMAERSDTAREQAIRDGMQQVLVRYTGYSNIESFSGVEQALENARAYMVEFAVETQSVPAVDGISATRAPALWIRYNASKLENLAMQLRLPVWPTSRPEVGYIVVQENAGSITFGGPNVYPALEAQLQMLFAARGLSAKPYLASLLRAGQIWEMGRNDLFALQQDSGADILLVVRVRGDIGTQRSAELVAVEDFEITQFQENLGNPFQDVSAEVNQFVDRFSGEVAYAAGSRHSADIFIGVYGLGTFSEYRELLNTLKNIDEVSTARLEEMTAEQMLFRITYGRGSERLFGELLERANLQRVIGRLPSLGTKTAPHLLSRAGLAPSTPSGSTLPSGSTFFRSEAPNPRQPVRQPFSQPNGIKTN